MSSNEMMTMIYVLIVLFEFALAAAIVFYFKYKRYKVYIEQEVEVRNLIQQRNYKLRRYRAKSRRLESSLKALVDANDNLYLNIDGKGDLTTALENARIELDKGVTE